MKEIGIYIHIPFCVKKCDYCDFISYSESNHFIKPYIQKLIEEIENVLQKEEYAIKTVYIGGGTPSFIDSKYIIEIMNVLKKNSFLFSPQEITIEVNPGTITEQKLLDYKKAGINRLSIGLQETNNNLLKQIGRIHTYEDFLQTYQLAKKVGFKNINVDLIIGLPNQTITNIKASLEKVINLKPQHISVYSLILEEGTGLYKKWEEKQIDLPSEEQERDMYWYVKNTLENEGYLHYEISNFAKQGYESKHNLSCWNQEEYIGCGAAAHSYLNGIRYSNTEKLEDYLQGSSPIIHEVQTKETMQKEYMLLGLRKIEGVSIKQFKNKFGENPIFLYRNELNKLVEKELLVIDGDAIRLTNKGLDLANIVWEEFVD